MEDNKTLINRIKNSGFSELQKSQLIQLLPFMKENQKNAMLSLIEKSKQVMEMEMDDHEKLKALNQKFWQKMKDKKREMKQYAQKQFQKLDKQESEKVLEDLEVELNAI